MQDTHLECAAGAVAPFLCEECERATAALQARILGGRELVERGGYDHSTSEVAAVSAPTQRIDREGFDGIECRVRDQSERRLADQVAGDERGRRTGAPPAAQTVFDPGVRERHRHDRREHHRGHHHHPRRGVEAERPEIGSGSRIHAAHPRVGNSPADRGESEQCTSEERLSGQNGGSWFEVVASIVTEVKDPAIVPIDFQIDGRNGTITVADGGTVRLTA
jgi:hypothetical protein